MWTISRKNVVLIRLPWNLNSYTVRFKFKSLFSSHGIENINVFFKKEDLYKSQVENLYDMPILCKNFVIWNNGKLLIFYIKNFQFPVVRLDLLATIVNQSAPIHSSGKVADKNAYAQRKYVSIQLDVKGNVNITYYIFEDE